jgi:RsiW-degrading membrane proteinase PrsW (M82 family)
MIHHPVIHLFCYFFNCTGISAGVVGLGIAFGAVWLACYWPPLFKKPWLWAVLVGSAFLTAAVVYFIQNPLMDAIVYQTVYGLGSHIVLFRLIMVVGIPLLKGLVQEGAKLVPVVVWWRRSARSLDPKLGLVIGAVAGAGFGIVEAQRALNCALAAGWTWHVMEFYILNGFWGIFFTVAAQIAFSALAGYGLARGWGWQFYLISSSMHGLLIMARGLFEVHTPASIPSWQYSLEAFIYTAVIAVLVTAWALWLRWRKKAATAEPETSIP